MSVPYSQPSNGFPPYAEFNPQSCLPVRPWFPPHAISCRSLHLHKPVTVPPGSSPNTSVACLSQHFCTLFSSAQVKSASSVSPSLTISIKSSSSPSISTTNSITCFIFFHSIFLRLYVHLFDCSLFAACTGV